MKRQRLVFTLLSMVVLILSCVALWLWKKPENLQAKVQEKIVGSGIAVPSFYFEKGETLEYEMSYTGQTEGSQKVYQLAGSLQMTVLEEEKDGYRVSLAMQPEQTLGFDQLDPKFRDNLIASYRIPVQARFARLGFDLSLYPELLPKGPALEFWQGMVDRTRVRLPERLTEVRFEQPEMFLNAPVKALYAVEGESEGDLQGRDLTEISLKKTYEHSPSAQRSIEGESVIVMRPSLAGIKQVVFKGTESIPRLNLSSHNELRLRYIRKFKMDDQELSTLITKMKAPLTQQASMSDAIQSNVLGALQMEDVWKKLAENPNQQAYLLMKAWIQLNPAGLGALLEKLKGLAADDPKLRASIKALTAVGSEEAQDVMVQLLEARKDEPATAQRIVSSLGFVKEPTVGAESALTQLVRSPQYPEVGRRAELALGIMGQRLAGQSDAAPRERAEGLQKSALERLGTSKNARESIISLGMLGNMGPSDRISLEPFLKSQDPELRGQAFFALRFSPQKDTPQFLTEGFLKDSSLHVKKQILQALALRTADPEWFKAVDQLLGRGVSEEDRLQLASAIVKNSRNYREESLRILTHMQKQGGSERMVQTLAQYHDMTKKGTNL